MLPRITTTFFAVSFVAAFSGAAPPDTGPPRVPIPRPSRSPIASPTPCNTAVNTPPLTTTPIAGPTMIPGLANGFTPPPAADPNSAPQADINDPAVQQLYNQGMQMMGPSPNPSSTPCLPDARQQGSELLDRIWAAANGYRGTLTGNLPGNGSESCAAAMQVVLERAGLSVPGDLTALMDSWRAAALSGEYGGSVIGPGQQMLAHRGAIIIWPETEDPVYGHIGVCANDGCTMTWSNHSGDGGSTSAFAYDPVTHQYINGGTEIPPPMAYTTFLIWEPANIP